MLLTQLMWSNDNAIIMTKQRRMKTKIHMNHSKRFMRPTDLWYDAYNVCWGSKKRWNPGDLSMEIVSTAELLWY